MADIETEGPHSPTPSGDESLHEAIDPQIVLLRADLHVLLDLVGALQDESFAYAEKQASAVDLIRSLEATVAAQHDQLNSLRIIVSDLSSRLLQQTSDPTQRSDAPLQPPQEVTQLMPTFPTTMALCYRCTMYDM